MEIIVGILALIAIVLVRGMRSRVGGLEQRRILLEERLAGQFPAALGAAPVASPTPPTAQPAAAPLAARLEALAPKPAPPVTPPPIAAGPTPDRPSVGFEEKFGTRWVVYVGGLALALVGIFLVNIRSSRDCSAPA